MYRTVLCWSGQFIHENPVKITVWAATDMGKIKPHYISQALWIAFGEPIEGIALDVLNNTIYQILEGNLNIVKISH